MVKRAVTAGKIRISVKHENVVRYGTPFCFDSDEVVLWNRQISDGLYYSAKLCPLSLSVHSAPLDVWLVQTHLLKTESFLPSCYHKCQIMMSVVMLVEEWMQK